MTHESNAPEREESNGMVTTMKFHIIFLCSNVFFNFSKVIITGRCKRCY